MGLFDFLKNIKKENKNTTHIDIVIKPGEKSSSKPVVDLEHLTAEGELPWGWVYHNREFTGKIGGEYTHFLNTWLDARQKSPKELHSALKSFVVYLEDAESLCKSKGECFAFWFYNILTSPDYIDKRKEELNKLATNLEQLQEKYINKQLLKPIVLDLLKENDGILQSELKKLVEEKFHNVFADVLYRLHRTGEIERTKSGKSYILHCKK